MLNQIIIMGRLTKEPVYKETDKYKLCRFSIACDRDYQQTGEERKTDFVNCTAFGGTASFVQKFFEQGDMIIVKGRLQIDVDRTEGYKSYTSIAVESAYFGGAKKEKSEPRDEHQSRFEELNGKDEDEFPF